jgi:hypothetical protein
MTLLAVNFDSYTARGAFDPRDGRPLHGMYRYKGPLGPVYVGWTDDDQMTWVDGPNTGPATLSCGVVIPNTTQSREALALGFSMNLGNEVVRVSGPYGGDVFLRFKGRMGEWKLEARRFKRFNRRIWRGHAGSNELLGEISHGTGKRSFRGQVVNDIQPVEVAILVFSWACFLQTVRPVGQVLWIRSRR